MVRLTYSYAPVSCLNECLCVACWAACSQDIMLRVLFSPQISPSIQYNLNYIPLFHYSVLYSLLCWAFSPCYTLQVHIFFVVYILLFTINKNICLYCIVSFQWVQWTSILSIFFVLSTYCSTYSRNVLLRIKLKQIVIWTWRVNYDNLTQIQSTYIHMYFWFRWYDEYRQFISSTKVDKNY